MPFESGKDKPSFDSYDLHSLKKNIAPENRPSQKESSIPSIFRYYVSFREGICCKFGGSNHLDDMLHSSNLTLLAGKLIKFKYR